MIRAFWKAHIATVKDGYERKSHHFPNDLHVNSNAFEISLPPQLVDRKYIKHALDAPKWCVHDKNVSMVHLVTYGDDDIHVFCEPNLHLIRTELNTPGNLVYVGILKADCELANMARESFNELVKSIVDSK